MNSDFKTDPDQLGEILRQIVTKKEGELKETIVTAWGVLSNALDVWKGDLKYRFENALSQRVNGVYSNAYNFLEGTGRDIETLNKQLVDQMNQTKIGTDGDEGSAGTATMKEWGFKQSDGKEQIVKPKEEEKGKPAQAVPSEMEGNIKSAIGKLVETVQHKSDEVMKSFFDTVGDYMKGDYTQSLDNYKQSLKTDLDAILSSYEDFKGVSNKTTTEHKSLSAQSVTDTVNTMSKGLEGVLQTKGIISNKWQ